MEKLHILWGRPEVMQTFPLVQGQTPLPPPALPCMTVNVCRLWSELLDEPWEAVRHVTVLHVANAKRVIMGYETFFWFWGGGRPEVLLCEHFTLREMCQSLNLVHIGLSGGWKFYPKRWCFLTLHQMKDYFNLWGNMFFHFRHELLGFRILYCVTLCLWSRSSCLHLTCSKVDLIKWPVSVNLYPSGPSVIQVQLMTACVGGASVQVMCPKPCCL